MKPLMTSLRLVAISLSVALIIGPLSQPAQAQNGATVRSIVVQYAGPQTVSRDRILSQMRTAVGQPYSETTVEQDIRNLYTSGNIQNVRIYAEPQGDGVKVVVVVATRTIVTEIEIEGAERVNPKRIRKEVGIKINAPLAEGALEEGRQKVLTVYQNRGFNDVSVDYRVDVDQRTGKSRVIYTINEGAKGAVKAIRFEGNSAFSDRTLRKQMKTRGKTFLSFFDKSGRLEQTQFEEDLDKIREWYQNHGYIDVDIKDVRRERTDGSTIIVIAIAEGQKYHVGRMTFTGQQVTTEDKLRAVAKMREGDVYSPKALRDDAKAISDAYGSGGYVDVDIVPQGVQAGAGLINVTYTIQEGVRSFVERINIVGNTRTKDKVLRREVLITPGDIFNTVRVDRSKKRLENLGYFEKVEAYPEETGIPGRKDLTVRVQEKRTGSLNFGAGFSTIDSLIGFVELTQGNFDLMNWPNFTGGGQKFRSRIQYGDRRKDFLIGLTEPYFLDQPLSLGGEAFFHESNFLSSVYDQRNYGFSVEARKPLTAFMSVGLGYRLEEIDIYDVRSDASALIKAEEGSRLKSEVSTSFVFDNRDNPYLTRRGTRIIASQRVAGGFLGGNTQIYGFDVEASQYIPLPLDTILLFNAEVAVVDNWGSGTRVPIFERLFLGGSNNLRGFNFRDVGPKDKNGEPLGGRTLARFTAEYTFPIVERIRGALFYDTGFVHSDAYDFGGEDLASDVGVGVRLDLPIGPLRIDYGIPVQRAGNASGGKFNFNVGYQF
jgi:outer membrane protein insertion porin family